MSIKNIFSGIFGGLINESPKNNTIFSTSGAIQNQQQANQQGLIHQQQLNSIGPAIAIPAGSSISTNQLGGLSTVVYSGTPANSFQWQLKLASHNKKIEEQKERLNSFDNNVKVIYEDLKPFIEKTNLFTVSAFGRELNDDIKICEILETHLRINKFNNKLEDIINE